MDATLPKPAKHRLFSFPRLIFFVAYRGVVVHARPPRTPPPAGTSRSQSPVSTPVLSLSLTSMPIWRQDPSPLARFPKFNGFHRR